MKKACSISGLLAATTLIVWKGQPTGLLLNLECLALMLSALAFGFCARNPRMPDWLRSDAVVGIALVYIGAGAAFVPANLILSSACIGCGLRLILRSTIPTVTQSTSTEIVIREATDETPAVRRHNPAPAVRRS